MSKKDLIKTLKNVTIKKILSSCEKTDISKEDFIRFRQEFLSDFHDFVKVLIKLVQND